MTQAFVYRWTERSTGKWYIGSRTRKGCHPEDGYICSSDIVKPLIKANPSDWFRVILAQGNPKDMRKLEIELLTNSNASKNPQSYNRTNGTGIARFNRTGMKDSASTRKKKSQAHMGKKRTDHSSLLSGRKRPEFAIKMKGRQKGELNGSAKTYIIQDPSGYQQEIKSLKTFCESIDKPTVTAREMASGKYPNNTAQRGAWAGWRIIFKE